MKIDFLRPKTYLKTLVKIAGVFLFVVIISFFSFRNIILRKVFEKISAKLNSTYECNFTYSDVHFSGINKIEITNLILIPFQKDTLLNIGKIECSFRTFHAFFLDFRLSELLIENGYIHLIKNKSGRNFDSFLHPKNKISENENLNETTKKNYAKIIFDLISKTLKKIPNELNIQKFSIKILDDERKEIFLIDSFKLNNDQCLSDIEVISKDLIQHWNINGIISTKNKTADLKFYNQESGKVRIPYLDERFNLVTGFDSIHLNLNSIGMVNDELKINGVAAVSNFLINHPKISKKDVVIENANFNYQLCFGKDFFLLDSTTEITFNQLHFHPYFKLQTQPDTVCNFKILIENTPAQTFINALPEGLFKHFKGMEASGNFSYSLNFEYNFNRPDNLIFDCNLKKEGLKILKFGEANLSKLNDDFIYTPIENDRPLRSISVSISNPNFIPLSQIPELLKNCVLTSEDPSFFYHRGFIDEAFRQSIIKDIQTRKFARGASSISMQLVKNVFLTREKTLSRKLEEILLVYILENNHLSTKERMFEVYLNIIEWGPNVYGIGEASQFYFKKNQKNLNLNECLFLTSIIPRPKGFMWRFDKGGIQKDFAQKQYQFLSSVMIRRNLLTPNDTIGLSQNIKITGPAKKLIFKTDSFLNDSLFLDENMDE